MKISHISVSRDQDTYGYTIYRLDDRETGKRYSCKGGGYDMLGKVFGDWLQDVYQKELVAHVANLVQTDCGFAVSNGTITLDGACGLKSMIRIAEAIGLDVQCEYQKTGRNRGATLDYLSLLTIKEG